MPTHCPGAHLHLREPHPGRQLAALSGAQVLLALEGALQGADLLRAEGRAQPPPAPATGLLRTRALETSLRLGLPTSSWDREDRLKGQSGSGTLGVSGSPFSPLGSHCTVAPYRGPGSGARFIPPLFAMGAPGYPTAAEPVITCCWGGRQALPASAASPGPRAGGLLLTPLAQATLRAGPVAHRGYSVRGALD